ncbi:uncharacterized protein LDX57_003268 [Aspergillus melleus]|uniref:uncharacterized protein n=1 Tax=Aspergillus melleus TaxID=138277 RepID=UPI001E8CBF3F|nr:uncharacterized protein LDX57_003268 [Aspergillus melleus]KAH8425517.1 hypothetical protein LDX57_003268 [Aspergillus melleus]
MAAGENEDSNPPAVKRPKDNRSQEQTVSAESGEASTAPARRKNTALRNMEDAASLSYFRVMMREAERKLEDVENRLETSKKGFQEALELFDRAKQSFREAKGVMDAIEAKYVNGE